jgi:hypothetical protein
LAKERLLAGEVETAPMLKQTLGGRRYTPIGPTGQAAPCIDVTPDFIG